MRRLLLLRPPGEFHEVAAAERDHARPGNLLTVRGVSYRFVSNPGAA